jgi:hypothetical protein
VFRRNLDTQIASACNCYSTMLLLQDMRMPLGLVTPFNRAFVPTVAARSRLLWVWDEQLLMLQYRARDEPGVVFVSLNFDSSSRRHHSALLSLSPTRPAASHF